MRRLSLVLVALVIAGCGRGDPAASLLLTGQLVVVAGPKPASFYGQIRDPDTGLPPVLAPGVTVRVGHDPGHYALTAELIEEKRKFNPASLDDDDRAGPRRFEIGHPKALERGIRVTVETGEHRGQSGAIARKDVRPLP